MIGISLAAAPAVAGMPVPVEMICPIGGETFSFTTTASYSTFGSRPDGRPYGSWHFPLDLPICPGNGLVAFQKDFTAEDKAALEKLVADPAYKALADSDTSYYRAAWLMQRLNRDPAEIADMILQASWQADDRPVLKRRYQAEFAAIVDPLIKVDGGEALLLMAGRAANAHRELGQFDAAGALLDRLPLATLATIVPVEERDGDTVTNQAAIDEAKGRRALLTYLTGLKDLVATRNAMAEPLSLLPIEIATERCTEVATLSDDDRGYCASDAMKQAIAPKQ